MDIFCPKCGEPWDVDTFHDIADEQQSTFSAVVASFRKNGCVSTGWTRCSAPMSADRQAMAQLIYEMGGDDVDGIASDFEDVWGLF